ncbi:MAG TPA: ABC transporter permease [Candidatus Acidoferrum sp.]|nr:ABC transporter permease [Candidatus Acidoferrum sp.]
MSLQRSISGLLRTAASGLRTLFRRKRFDGDLNEELRSFLDMAAEEKTKQGQSHNDALRAVRLQHGSLEIAKEEVRSAGWESFLENSWQDLRFAIRMLRKSPGFTAVAVLTLALGIGANTAIFSVVNAVLLRPLPYANSGQLVFVSDAKPEAGISGLGMSFPTFMELRDHNRAFNAIAGFGAHALVLTGSGEPSELSTVVVTSDFFSVLAADPMLGQVFISDDDRRGAAPAAILSENLWRSRFGADPGIIGRSITLDMRPYTVIGVMPASFHTPFITQANQVWIPLAQDPLFSVWMTKPPQEHWMAAIARVRPDISFDQAKAELDTISAGLAKEFPVEKGWTIGIEPLQQTITGGVRLPLLLLLGAVGLVLLIACANMANLLLSRATSRSKEIAVRIALGAGRGRLARQLLTECAILGLLGGIIGTLAAYGGIAALVPLLPPGLPKFHSIRLDGPVLVFAFVLSLITSVVFGLAPVLSAAGSDPHKELGEGARAGESAGPRRARSLLAVGEIALAMVLLTGAGLLMRSFARLTSVNPGFQPNHVVKAMVSLPQFQYATPKQWSAFSEELMTRLQAQPGMQDSAVAGPLPIVDCCVTLAFQIVGNPPPEAGAADTANYVPASPRYFPVMGIPLLRGRLFNESDSSSSVAVTLISEALAKRYFPNEDPLGRHLTFGFPVNGIVSREIVGIVGDIHDVSLGKEPGPMLYVPYAQAPLYGGEVVVKSTLNTSAVVSAIRAVTHDIDKNLPVTDIVELPDVLNASVAQPRFRTLLLGLFSAIALLLAAVGIFGVISYSVGRRTHELGIRMALGAQPGAVLTMILRETLALTLIGIAVGVPCAIAAARLITHLLFNVTPYDPITLAVVPLVLVAVGALASYIPARRAMKVDPIVALRCE